MKTLLVATDYSKASLNAVKYAAELAIRTKSILVLFHAFHSPVIISEVPVVLQSVEDMELANMNELKKLEKQLKVKYGIKLKTSLKVSCGLAVDEICDMVKKLHIDLVIVGMQGAGYLSERLAGSTSTTLIQQADFPVLCVNEKVKYKALKRIAFACDYHELKNIAVLEPLKKLAEQFKSHLYILKVIQTNETATTISEAVAGIRLEQAVEKINHSFHTLQHEDIVEGINSFAVANNIDLTVMIPRKHSVLKNILKEPTSKRMAFHTQIPLLTLHE